MEADEKRAELLRLFRVIFAEVKSHFARIERTTGVGGSKLWALSLVGKQPGMGVGELAHAMSVRQPTASQIIKQLQLQGFLDAKPHPKDGRALQLYLTVNGMRLVEEAPLPHAGILPQAISELEQDVVDRLILDLKQLAATLHYDETFAATPLDKL